MRDAARDQRRREAALKIDPETAEVEWCFGQTTDPYDEHVVSPEHWQVGRTYFARSPASDVWIWFGDLPEEVAGRLGEKHRAVLGFNPFTGPRDPASCAALVQRSYDARQRIRGGRH
jgi:hypothetical protein